MTINTPLAGFPFGKPIKINLQENIMNKNFSRIPGFLSVVISLLLVLAACAPALTPGFAPREIILPSGEVLNEEVAQFGDLDQFDASAVTPVESIDEDINAVSEAVTLEDFLGRLDSIIIPGTDDEFFGVTAALVEDRWEEHMITGFSAGVAVLDQDLSLIDLAPAEGYFEEHMVTEFAAGIISLDEEISTAALSPVEGLLDENIIPDLSILEGVVEEHMVTEFSTGIGNLDAELMGIELAPVEGWFEEHMVTEFPVWTGGLDEEISNVELAPVEGLTEEEISTELAPAYEGMEWESNEVYSDNYMTEDY